MTVYKSYISEQVLYSTLFQGPVLWEKTRTAAWLQSIVVSRFGFLWDSAEWIMSNSKFIKVFTWRMKSQGKK